MKRWTLELIRALGVWIEWLLSWILQPGQEKVFIQIIKLAIDKRIGLSGSVFVYKIPKVSDASQVYWDTPFEKPLETALFYHTNFLTPGIISPAC